MYIGNTYVIENWCIELLVIVNSMYSSKYVSEFLINN